jgi:hypothetical protein
MHTGKELEVHQVERGRWSCNSDATHVGSARSDWTTVVRVNRRKMNRRKTSPYCIITVIIECAEHKNLPKYSACIFCLILKTKRTLIDWLL